MDVDVADAHRGRFDGDTAYTGAGYGFANRRSNKVPVVKKEADDSWEDVEMEVSFIIISHHGRCCEFS